MQLRILNFEFRVFQPPPLSLAWVVGGHSELRIPNSEFISHCWSLDLISVIEKSRIGSEG